MRENLVDFAQKLMTFKTTHKNYAEISMIYQYIEQTLKSNINQPFTIEKIETVDGYSYLYRTNTSKREFEILLSGHVDVVPGCDELFKTRIEDGLLVGRGAADMKATDAAMIYAFIVLLNKFPDRRIALSLTMDEEEGDSEGMKQLIKEGLKSEMIFIPDSAEHWAITLEQKGYYTCEANISGISAHGASPWLGTNAISHAATLIYEIQKEFISRYDLAKEENPWVPTLNIGTIYGGSATNQVPDFCSFTLDFRFSYKHHVKEFRDLVNSCIKKTEISAKVTDVFDGESTWIGKNNDLINDLVYHLEKRSMKFTFERENGASEARFFAGLHNTVMFMPECGGSHEDYEWIDIESLNLYFEVILEYFIGLLHE
jgi:succinyl-diaminopimelate desuccinylase